MKIIDLNCDLGEWVDENDSKRDAAIMPYITSCNIACGGHIGDEESMLATIKLAYDNNVAIGAHPSYPDKENFGRKVIEITDYELKKSLMQQLEVFTSYVEKEGAHLHHIKPHGALYNEASINNKVAQIIVSAILSSDFRVPVYCQQGSKLDQVVTQSGLATIYEVFADRAYETQLMLRSRRLKGAVLHEKEAVFEHIHRMIIEGNVKTYSGQVHPINADTICLHSDTEGSVELAREINMYLKSNGVQIAST